MQTVLASYINAIGGADKVKAVKSLMITSEAEVQGMKLEMVNKVKDGYLSSEQKMMGAVMSKQIITPKMGYAVVQGQKTDLSGDDLTAAQAEATPFGELKANETAVLTGIESINGVDAYGVKVENTTSYYDTTTGLKVAVVQEVEQMGQKMQQVVNYTEYKEVKGIKFPFVQTMNVGIEIEMKIKEVKVNEGVSDADFK